MFNKMHTTLVANNNELYMMKKKNQNSPSSLDQSYTYCHLQLKCNYVKVHNRANDVLPCVISINYFTYF